VFGKVDGVASQDVVIELLIYRYIFYYIMTQNVAPLLKTSFIRYLLFTDYL